MYTITITITNEEGQLIRRAETGSVETAYQELNRFETHDLPKLKEQEIEKQPCFRCGEEDDAEVMVKVGEHYFCEPCHGDVIGK